MQESQSTKLITYIGMGINTLVITGLLYLAQIINSNNVAVSRFEEKFTFLFHKIETIDSKLDTSITRSQETNTRVTQLEVKVENQNLKIANQKSE
jgi:hypothetical protein